MTHTTPWRRSVLVAAVLILASVPTFANHSWNNYHWARTSNPFTLKLYDNVTSIWEPYVSAAVSDWNRSTVLDYSVQWQSPLSGVKRCTSASGVVEICNSKYGNNGWLGIAGISISGSHITKGYTKLNDSYFTTATYNTPAWRLMVTCQEIAHDFGLDHQDEAFNNANVGSCMDYTNDPDGGAGGASSNDPSNEHPNQHDFDQIQSIYAHTDSSTTISSLLAAEALSLARPATAVEAAGQVEESWGTAVRYDKHGRPNVFAAPRSMNAKGELEIDFTFVFWAPDAPQTNGQGND